MSQTKYTYGQKVNNTVNDAFKDVNPSWQHKKKIDFREKIFQEIQSIIQPDNEITNLSDFFKQIKTPFDEEIIQFEVDSTDDLIEDDYLIFKGPIFQQDELIRFENEVVKSVSNVNGLDHNIEPITDLNSSETFENLNSVLSEKKDENTKQSLLSLTLNLISNPTYYQAKVDFQFGIENGFDSSFFQNDFEDYKTPLRKEFQEFYFSEKPIYDLESIFIRVFRNKSFKLHYEKEKFKRSKLIDLEKYLVENFSDVFHELQGRNINFFNSYIYREKIVEFVFHKFKDSFNHRVFFFSDYSFLPNYFRFNNCFSFIPICNLYLPLDFDDFILSVCMTKGCKLMARNNSLVACIYYYSTMVKKFKYLVKFRNDSLELTKFHI